MEIGKLKPGPKKISKRMLGMLKLLQKNRYREPAPSCKLIKRKLSPNPGVPRCTPHCRLDMPQLLLKHHSIEGLELWHCPSCHRKILFRVQREN